MSTSGDSAVARLPRSYLIWLGGALVSQVGDAALYFALGWAASAHGGPAAGLVLSCINLPRTALLLVGGAMGDRLGARLIMITGDGVMFAVAAILAALMTLLLLVAGVAGFVIPVMSLLVPFITRQHHWTADVAGTIVGGQSVGGIVMALTVARRGAAARPGLAAALGLATIAAGELTIALSPTRVLAVLGAVIMGLGTGTFVCNLAPVLMATTPRSHLARVQSLLVLAQSGALLVSNNVLGAVANATSATGAMITCASVVATCALIALLVPAIRHLTTPGVSPPMTLPRPQAAENR